MNTSHYDIVIIGAGIVGASLACALAELDLSVALIDKTEFPTQFSAEPDLRVSAITPLSQQFFAELGVWDLITTSRLGRYQKMHVWDQAGHVEFNAAEINRSELGWLIENSAMLYALGQQVKSNPMIHYYPHHEPQQLTTFYDGASLLLQQGQRLFAPLLIGADGANSWVRKKLGLAVKSHPYQQTAIIANVRIAQPHQQTAWQRFLATGPLAFLPLMDSHQASIVWSLSNSKAQELITATPEEFSAAITEAFENRLGQVTLSSERQYFPLIRQQIKSYIGSRVALVGDAIHSIHPLAGLGLNLGLMDALSLKNTIQVGRDKNQDYGSQAVLLRYQREQKGKNTLAMVTMDGFKHLFSNDAIFLSWLRNQGLSLVNDCSPLKAFFIRQAQGAKSK